MSKNNLPTQLIYFHGFNSGFDVNHPKIKALNNIVDRIVGRTTNYLDKNDVEQLIKFIDDAIQSFPGETILIGTSLGGYFARFFADFFKLRVITLNPAVNPQVSLMRALGENKNYLTGESYIVTKSDVEQLAAYSVKSVDDSLMVLATDDEVIPYELPLQLYGKTCKVVLTTGGHRLENLNMILPDIVGFINRPPIATTLL